MFHGAMVALVTPMQENGEIDYSSLEQLVEWHIEQGTRALVVLGTTGEAATMSAKEHIAVMRHAVDVAKERIPIIGGSYATSTAKTIELSFAVMETGADACLIMTPAYIKPTQEGLYQHYKAIAEQVPIPQILYNVPSRTACDLLPQTIARLSTVSNIIGVKEATGDVNRVYDIIEHCDAAIDIYSGDDLTALGLLLAGGKGIISVTGNVAPQAMSQLCDAALQGNTDEAKVINNKLMPLHKALFVESNPIPVKWALHEMGRMPAGIRLPLTALSVEHHETVRQALQEAAIL